MLSLLKAPIVGLKVESLRCQRAPLGRLALSA